MGGVLVFLGVGLVLLFAVVTNVAITRAAKEHRAEAKVHQERSD